MDDPIPKKQLKELLAAQYPKYTKDQIEAFIACRQVIIAGETCTDLAVSYPADSKVEIVVKRYVSRGGLKLEYALHYWDIDPTGLVMLDAGASTGGFTDCLLQHGASTVHAVDVGYNQLDYKLRVDNRVVVHERTNIMHVTALEPQPMAAVADLSFRSITGAAQHILSLTRDAWMISLIKPQFEVAKGKAGFSGVILDDQLLFDVILDVYHLLQEENVGIAGIVQSPIVGRKGNREFLALLRYKEQLPLSKFTSTLRSIILP